MANYLRLNKKLFGVDGTIPLKRGDAWTLNGNVVEKYAGYEAGKDMTGRSATAFFPGADEEIAVAVTFPEGNQGAFSIAVDAEDTAGAALAESGTSFYLVTDQDETIETPDQPLEIRDRGFNQD